MTTQHWGQGKWIEQYDQQTQIPTDCPRPCTCEGDPPDELDQLRRLVIELNQATTRFLIETTEE